MFTFLRFLAIVAFAIATGATQTAAVAQAPQTLRQFVYVLRVVPALHDSIAWTSRENDAVGRHFARLTEATKLGKVIFAGKTAEPLNATFGLVVFEAENEAAARQFMESDPAVVAGVMSATLHPYSLALQRK
ncbi:MAG: YciI family protein [Rubrivivax sp.]|nr:YciI family protein [Rubrivivax sp.]